MAAHSEGRIVSNPAELAVLAAELLPHLRAGDAVRLTGPLGAGKTTFVRALLAALGHGGPVRSPTFSLVQAYATRPPVLHADLYRVASAEGIGLEEYLDSHLCLVEWPDRADGLFPPEACWRVDLQFTEPGRRVTVTPPSD